MGYIGNQSSEAYSSVDKQVITGNGGTAYTLSHSVANANEIEVFVNNVRQEPGIAYTVSAGTSLAMTGNVESTDDFYVVFQGKAVQTARHPSDQDLEAVDGTFTGDLTVDTNTLKVDSTNNRVGIGTASPTLDGSLAGLSVNGSGTVLHVNDGDGATLKLTDPATGANRGLGITLQGTSAAISNCESGELRFGTGNTERGRFDASGNLLIGNSTFGAEDGVYISQGGNYVWARSDDTSGYFDRTGSDGKILELRKDGTAIGSIKAGNGDLLIGTGNVNLRFFDATPAVIPRTSADGTSNGAVDLGNASNRFKNLYLFGGAYIGGTGSANHLDDYEEGTFTPVFQQGITTPGYSTQTGTYIKIGRQVICSIQLRATSGTENSSHIYVGGLPFTITNDVDHSFGAFWTYSGGFWTSSANTSFLGLRNTTNLAFYKQADGGAIVGTDPGVAGNLNADLRIVAIYRTD